MKCQTQRVVVVIVTHHQGQGHVASVIMLLSAYFSIRIALHTTEKSFHATNWVLRLRGPLVNINPQNSE